MNKRILSVFVCCALYYSAQAQDAKGGISADMMQQIKQSYQGTSTDKATFRNETLPQILDYLAKSAALKWKTEEAVQQADDTFTKKKIIVDLY